MRLRNRQRSLLHRLLQSRRKHSVTDPLDGMGVRLPRKVHHEIRRLVLCRDPLGNINPLPKTPLRRLLRPANNGEPIPHALRRRTVHLFTPTGDGLERHLRFDVRMLAT